MKLDPPPHTASTSVLTAAEVAFAIQAGVPPAVFEGVDSSSPVLDAALNSRDGEVREKLYTTQQVAERLTCHPARVRRMRTQGDLYRAGQVDRRAGYPAWQFTSSGVLPHLRQVIAAFPSGYHPRDIATVMTSAAEELHSRSPSEWLEAGEDPGLLLELLRGLSL